VEIGFSEQIMLTLERQSIQPEAMAR